MCCVCERKTLCVSVWQCYNLAVCFQSGSFEDNSSFCVFWTRTDPTGSAHYTYAHISFACVCAEEMCRTVCLNVCFYGFYESADRSCIIAVNASLPGCSKCENISTKL